LIIAAIAALAVVAYIIYKNWDTIWKAIQASIQFVWDWIKANWPLLLGILMGPIGIAAALIYKYWDQILSGIQGVWNWIKGAWAQVVSFLVAPVAAAINWIAGAWGAVTGAISGVVNWIRSVWAGLTGAITGPIQSAVSSVISIFNGIIGGIAGIPGRIISLFSIDLSGAGAAIMASLARGVASAGQAVINAAQSVVDKVKSLLPFSPAKAGPLHDYPPELGGANIVKMIAQGMTSQAGLIDKAAVSIFGGPMATNAPIANAQPTGPAVQIENAYFQDEADIDAFMRQAAWAVRTRAV
jgi:phage-related protein